MKVFFLMGPTASGKTALACDWVTRFPFEIVSVDSAMIYRGMNIGTAKPTAEVLKKAPHHLIDICDPIDPFSVAHFCEKMQALVPKIYERGHIPLLVGGTMMYFNALQQGLNVLPKADDAIRAQLNVEVKTHGLSYLYDQLCQVDPHAAARIHAHDQQRIQRALEVFLQTGRPLSTYFQESVEQKWTYVPFALFPTFRHRLHEAIAQRFQMMLKEGFIEEVAALKEKWNLSQEYPSMRCVGYRQALDYLSGIVDHKTFVERSLAATRQLAKRQLTWLRQWKDAIYIDPYDAMMHNQLLHDVSVYLER